MEEKSFYWPVWPKGINQRFGENSSCVSLDGNNKVITCDGNNPPTGYKSLYGTAGHLGLDLQAYHGQEVYAVRDGVVSFIDTNEKSGLDVRVVSVINGVEYKHIYEHLLGYKPKVGDKVMTGQILGWADNTGYSSGNHLHFQLEKMINGVFIPIDPLPLMDNIYALDILKIQNQILYIKEIIAKMFDTWGDKLRTNK